MKVVKKYRGRTGCKSPVIVPYNIMNHSLNLQQQQIDFKSFPTKNMPTIQSQREHYKSTQNQSAATSNNSKSISRCNSPVLQIRAQDNQFSNGYYDQNNNNATLISSKSLNNLKQNKEQTNNINQNYKNHQTVQPIEEQDENILIQQFQQKYDFIVVPQRPPSPLDKKVQIRKKICKLGEQAIVNSIQQHFENLQSNSVPGKTNSPQKPDSQKFNYQHQNKIIHNFSNVSKNKQSLGSEQFLQENQLLSTSDLETRKINFNIEKFLRQNIQQSESFAKNGSYLSKNDLVLNNGV